MLLRTALFSLFLVYCRALEKRFIEREPSFLSIRTGTPALGRYKVDKSQISVSGISSGGAMATQLHVIYSSRFMGVGIIAGIPFACTQGGGIPAALECMTQPELVDPDALEEITDLGADAGNIDATTNMKKDKVYIFNGELDTVVNPGIGPVIKDYYSNYVKSANKQIKTVFNLNAEHGHPTNNYGGPCESINPPEYMNNCNYSSAYDLLNFIYGGNLKKPDPGAMQTGQLLQFDQKRFVPEHKPSDYSMDDIGYVYVPQRCASKRPWRWNKSGRRNDIFGCRLHVALHGCQMGQKHIGDHYVVHGGYNEVADLNNIIILYPQVIKTDDEGMNPSGCWDWWGYTGELFATNDGVQPDAIKKMIDRITG